MREFTLGIITPNNINININTNNDKQEGLYKNIENLLKDFLEKTTTYTPDKKQFVDKILKKYDELEIGEAIKIAIRKGKNGDIHYLEGILKNRNNNGINYNLSDNGINIKNIAADKVILNKLSNKFENINNLLEYYYFYNQTYYFKTNENIPISIILAGR
jgi:hypothetical protein